MGGKPGDWKGQKFPCWRITPQPRIKIERWKQKLNTTTKKENYANTEIAMNVRLNPACVELIKLERRTLPGCHSDGEALESIIFRSAVSEEARQIIRRAAAREAAKDPLFVAAGSARKPKSVRPPTNTQQDPKCIPLARYQAIRWAI